jgi:hypothetical protein
MAAKWKIYDRIALKSDPKHKGLISQQMPVYDQKDPIMYSVKWDNGSASIYYENSLVPEKEAQDLLNELDKIKEEDFKKSVSGKKNASKNK